MGWMAPLRHLGAKLLVGREPPANREPSMNEITTVGLSRTRTMRRRRRLFARLPQALAVQIEQIEVAIGGAKYEMDAA
jgi:hypothetical protein